MDQCKHIEELLLFTEELSDKDEAQVNAHLQHCARCGEFKQRTTLIMRGLKSDFLLQDEALLDRYVVYKAAPDESDFDGRRLTNDEVERIEARLQESPVWRRLLEEKETEFRALRDFIEEAPLPDMHVAASYAQAGTSRSFQLWSRVQEAFGARNRRMPAILAATAAAILLMVLYNPFRSPVPPLAHLANLETMELSYQVRGEASQEFVTGMMAFNDNDYAGAVHHLQNAFLESGADDPQLDFKAYTLGLARLYRGVQEDDPSATLAAIEHFMEVEQRTDNRRLAENAAWFRGKALLHVEDPAAAIEAFRTVAALNGVRRTSAQKIVVEIENHLQISE